MARGGVNKAVVQAARLAILARGENPSIDAVRIEMGNTGSKTTIHRYLKELDGGAERHETSAEPIDDELMDLVSRLAQRLKEQAQAPIDQARAQFDQQKKVLDAQLNEARETNGELHQQYEIQSLALTQESTALQETRSMLQTEQTRNAGLNQALADFELRLKDKDEQIHSLEDKHLHARDALEHYRNAVKDQREQEQRRHEGQVQQIQMELRQAQQSALVRQDEITQLHRDNERLLTENRGTLRELSLLQEQLKQTNNRQDQLLEHANRVDSERTLLQERLRVALLDSQSLKQNVDEQSQANARLETELAQTQTSLEQLRLATAVAAAPDTTNTLKGD
ncbi:MULTISPECIES: DNA-binding protein [unclassified Pseudomonas]|uniref:DNA-binding protein n=1 Tax=unclassified Pseudomonas TaxID=196821 RepID=UPI002AC8C809|nr:MULTISPECIES: DNA-binding protein [unclassified Pseudomonas]MEB0046729.1 DNA-binding protein [Pseudomonas sp. Dout3]MEB0097663.1 DNA-binding protein [Pseudomonas sp. DC1.2]WPX61307.1 DNA-binding protein [Pseudomonas sp. DC1.2]